jgi:type I restriction enzyme S subunit
MNRWTAIGACVAPVESWNPVREGNGNLIQYVDISSIQQDHKAIEPKPLILAREAPSRARQLVQAGDILVSTVRPNLNAVARVPETLDGATASTGFCVLRPDNKYLIGEYLFHWVRSPEFISEMVKRATGASYPAVSDRIILSSKLPLPSVQDQQRIAAILNKVDEMRAKRRAALAQVDTLIQAYFLDVFGNPVVSQAKWPIMSLAEACGKITDGTHNSPPTQANGIPYVTAKHLKEHGLDFESDPWFVSEADHRQIFARCDPRQGDVLYIKDGATTGIAAINHYTFEFSMLSSLALLRPSPSKVVAEYLCFWLNNPLVKRELLGGMAGAAIRRLTIAKLKAIRIPIPPLELQHAFARRVVAVEKLKAAHRSSLAEMGALFASLQHRAFRGEL